MDAAAFERVYGTFQDFHAYFAALFGRRETRDHSRHYLQALLVQSGERRNAENLSETVPASARAMQRFLTESPWDDDAVIGRLQEYLGPRLGHPEAVWVLDGSDFPKQGVKSVGVARQYCGRLGKVANCQAGMFLAYVSPLGRALVDKGLYLPESWTADQDRCQAAGVPEGEAGATGRRPTWRWRCWSGAICRLAGLPGMMPSGCRRPSARDWRPWGCVTSWTFRRALRCGLRSSSGPGRHTRAGARPVNPDSRAGSGAP